MGEHYSSFTGYFIDIYELPLVFYRLRTIRFSISISVHPNTYLDGLPISSTVVPSIWICRVAGDAE